MKKVEISGIECTFLLFYAKITSAFCIPFFESEKGNHMKDTIMEMPDYQRPYEKCLREGEQSLSDRELLAVILRCGVQGLSSLTLADKILNLSEQTGHSGLLGLFHASVPELMKIHGIGKVKAIQLKCIGELSKRMQLLQRSRNCLFSILSQLQSIIWNSFVTKNRNYCTV